MDDFTLPEIKRVWKIQHYMWIYNYLQLGLIGIANCANSGHEFTRYHVESKFTWILWIFFPLVDVRDFPFIESPDKRSLNETVDALKAQGIIEPKAEKSLTSLGTYLPIKASIDERETVILKI